jgi:1-deoxy-D-xylulose-5-phosphate synthase
MVPGVRIAAPRDEPTLRELLREAVEVGDGPTVLRYPKTPLGADLPAVRRIGTLDVLDEPGVDAAVDVLVVAVGSMAADVLEAAAAVKRAGYTVRVVAPRWVIPVDPALVGLAGQAALVVTVEDGVAAGGIGARIGQTLRDAGQDGPTREIGIPVRFLEHGSVADVRAAVGLTVQDIGRRIVEWSAKLAPGDAGATSDEDIGTAPPAREFGN